jgi:hypothetical protein
MTAFETVCQMWSKEYIPTLKRWGFKITEVPREVPSYLVGEKCWDIEWGKKTKATIIIYAHRWDKTESIHIKFMPVCSWDYLQNAIAYARIVFDKITARLVVSAAIQRHIWFRPAFIRRLGGKEVLFKFTFRKNKWCWSAWVFDFKNFTWGDKPYAEFAGTRGIDPITAFKQFERALCLELLV